MASSRAIRSYGDEIGLATIIAMTKISVVSPVYQAAEIIPHLVGAISTTMDDLVDSFEIILVEDRSRDSSWEAITKECQKSSRVKGIRLSRNFGQHCAITAGLRHAKGEWVVVMDCDLQDRPDQIPALYHKGLQGFDVVFARRRSRKDSKLKKLYSRLFYSIFSYLTGTKQDASIANFGIYRKKVIHAVLSMKDNIRYFPAMVQWVGFSSATVDVEHSARLQGESTYNFKRMLILAINNIISFSDKPLRLVAQGGLCLSFVSLLIGMIYLVGYLFGAITVPGYASVIVSIWLTAGINIFVLGLVGIYVGKAFEKIKDRPVYIIDEVLNSD
jgi:glycosyltransferase involved in cell wall biosynthesis